MGSLMMTTDSLALMWLLPGYGEIWLLAIVVLVLFGGPKIPEFFRGLGSGISELKKGLKEGAEEDSPSGEGSSSSDNEDSEVKQP
jgi:sec-independent protein translocase protein TatA